MMLRSRLRVFLSHLLSRYIYTERAQDRVFGLALPGPQASGPNAITGPIETKLLAVTPIRAIVIGALADARPDTHALVKAISVQGGRKMHAQMGMDPQQAAARIKTQLIRTLGTIAARGRTRKCSSRA
jgi:hypothetical protein